MSAYRVARTYNMNVPKVYDEVAPRFQGFSIQDYVYLSVPTNMVVLLEIKVYSGTIANQNLLYAKTLSVWLLMETPA